MMERLIRIPLIGSLTAIVLALAWFLRPIDRSALFPVHFGDGSMGYVSADGRIAIEHLRSADSFDALGCARIERGDSRGLMNRAGAIVAEGKFFRPFGSQGLAAIRRDGKWGYVDPTGRLVIPAEWDQGWDFGSWGLALVNRGGKCGFIDPTGRLEIPLEWDDADLWQPADPNDLLPVNRGGRWGYIDRTGRLVVPAEWDDAWRFDSSNLVPVRKGTRWGYLDRNGRVAIAVEWDHVTRFNGSDVAIVEKAGLWGAIDRTGKLVIPAEWEHAQPFDSSGFAVVSKDGKYGYIDPAGRLAILVEWDHAESFGTSDLAIVSRGGGHGFIDRTGRLVIPARWRFARPFDESGIARVEEGVMVNFINRSGNPLVPPEFEGGDIVTDGPVRRLRVWTRVPDDEHRRWFPQLPELGGLVEKVAGQPPPRVMLCCLYDPGGRLVWSSDGFSERTWMVIAGIAISLLLVVEVGWLVSRNRGAA